jgi:hypothetical protein
VSAPLRTAAFDPGAYSTFRFVAYDLAPDGELSLRYALDDEVAFEERLRFPVPEAGVPGDRREELDRALWLLHLVAGVSYFKTAVPSAMEIETALPGPAIARCLETLYRQGLGEFAYRNGLEDLPGRIAFPSGRDGDAGDPAPVAPGPTLVPVGGGKDSAVSIEMLRRSGRRLALFSVNDAAPIRATAEVAGLPRLLARRAIAPNLPELNARGALNGHVPITAVVSMAAVVTAVLNGFRAVAMSNERSASEGNVRWQGIEVNHQYSKSLGFERALRSALAHTGSRVDCFSALRPAGELAIARAFARLDAYHGAITSCNAAFRIDEARRATGWCGDCPKCRFVFLALAPFMAPDALIAMIGRDMLADEGQYDGFAALTGITAAKPFECVGEEAESVAAFRLLAGDPHWREAPVVRRFAVEVLSRLPDSVGDPEAVLALGGEHEVPDDLLPLVHATLGR